MANPNLNLAPQQSSSGGFTTGAAPGQNLTALRRASGVKLPPPPSGSARGPALQRLAVALARLPNTPKSRGNASTLFLP